LNDSIPDPLISESARKSFEISQNLANSIQPFIETQEKLRAISPPIGKINALNDAVLAFNEVLHPMVDLTEAIADVTKGLTPIIQPPENLCHSIASVSNIIPEFCIDTSPFQMVNTEALIFQPTNLPILQSIVSDYAATLKVPPISPFLSCLLTIDMSPLSQMVGELNISEPLQRLYEELKQVHLWVLYKAKWFPYAVTFAGDALFDEINEILYSSRTGETLSKRCEKRIDKAILSYYTKTEIKKIRKRWNNSDVQPHFKKALRQTIDAYFRKEYALVIPALATMWEGIIKSKINIDHKKIKEDVKKLIGENGYDDVYSDFYNNLIIGTCYSVKDVVDGVPNRNATAHSWYLKYPSQKTALNAILLTDFLLHLQPTKTPEV
jgi:hypothetical protein